MRNILITGGVGFLGSQLCKALINEGHFEGFPVNNDFNAFVNHVDIIIANRMHPNLDDVKDKVFTRDLFNDN